MSEEKKSNFIRTIIDEDNASGKHGGKVHTRFPPEPNGFLHIGHAKSICLNFTLAKEYGGKCNLRFDDTNPVKEDESYIQSIEQDIKWLGFEWADQTYYASGYFDKFYEFAEHLIEAGKAFVCELNAEQMREYRGTLKEPGKPSPFRDRTVAENLDLFRRMKAGEFPDGSKSLRAKIDMASPNINMRDPVLYRIRKAHHHQTGDQWCIYPMYDYAHCISDALEGITHSICTLEFEDHRPLYDWILDQLPVPCHPQQIEFARLNIDHTVMSKRKLLQLVEDKIVEGWDDPRMPTIAGMRRRGYPPAAIRDFCDRIGVAKVKSVVEFGLLEFCVREELNRSAPRALAVLHPLKVTITNYEEGKVEEIDAVYHPQDESYGTRKLPFSKNLLIERDDFMEEPPKKFFRLAPGKEVRLRYGYIIKCDEVVKDDSGEVVELKCSIDPDTLGKNPADGRKVKGIIHWVSEPHAKSVPVRLYDRLFTDENPDGHKDKSFLEFINPASLTCLTARVEPSLVELDAGKHIQFERLGYFFSDPVESKPGAPVFNRSATLRDSWAGKGK